MNIFITGATGNIGSFLTQELHKMELECIVGLSKTPEKTIPFPYKLIDFGDKDSIISAFQGVETLFLLIPAFDSFLDWARNALDAAKEAGVKHIVRSSAICADPNSKFAVLKAHGQIDEWLKECEIPYTLTQPASFMQNFANYLAFNIQQGTVYSSTGTGKSSWIDVRDIAAANASILADPGSHVNKTYTLTGSESFSMREGLRRISETTGKPIRVVDIPQEAANETMKKYGMSDGTIRYIASIERATKSGILSNISLDLRGILKRESIGFNQFVQDYMTSWIEQA